MENAEKRRLTLIPLVFIFLFFSVSSVSPR